MAAQTPAEPVVAEKEPVVAKSLAEILDSNEEVEASGTAIESSDGEDDGEGSNSPPPAEGYCIECEGVFVLHNMTRGRPGDSVASYHRPTGRSTLRGLWGLFLRGLLRLYA